MTYRYLTFDCYGTLIDWKTGIERSLAAELGSRVEGREGLLGDYLQAERREEASYKKYREVLKGSFMAVSASLGVPPDEGGAASFADSLPRWPAFPDSVAFLKEMGSMGYARYILSNVDNDLLEETVRNAHLDVDGFVTAEELGSYKPAPRHWLEFLRRVGADKGSVLHVAQSVYHDIIPAQGLGIASAWVNRYSEPLPRGAAPWAISDSLRNLKGVLEGTA